jgi:hypothetical protein
MKDLQLLRDVDTRWSSTLLMIERALLLRQVRVLISLSHPIHQNFQAIEKFLESNEFRELRKFCLDNAKWQKLQSYQSILEVSYLRFALLCLTWNFLRSLTPFNKYFHMRRHQHLAMLFRPLRRWHVPGKLTKKKTLTS